MKENYFERKKAITVVALATTTKYYRLDGLNDKKIFVTVLETESSRSKCQQGWGLVRAVPLDYRWPLFSLSSLGLSLVFALRKSMCSLVSS